MPKKEKWYSRNGESMLYTNSPIVGWEFLVKEKTHGMDYLDIKYYLCRHLDVCWNDHDSLLSQYDRQ